VTSDAGPWTQSNFIKKERFLVGAAGRGLKMGRPASTCLPKECIKTKYVSWYGGFMLDSVYCGDG
jgi:hypothetical protein